MRRFTVALLAAALFFGVAAAADGGMIIPNRLARAKPGEWVLLADLSAPGEQARWSVLSVGEEDGQKYVEIQREKIDADGKVTDTTTRKVKLDRYAERMRKLDEKAKRISREKITIKDKEIVVYAVEWDDAEHDREVKIWLSDDIPVGGLVRMWSSDPDFPTYELVDFGEK